MVKAAGETGEVKDIGLFATTLHTPNNEMITLPNGAVTAGNITNYTRLGTRRVAIPVSVAYGTNLARAQEVLLQAALACKLVLKDPGPAIVLTNFAPSSLEFSVVAWARTGDFGDMQDQLRRAIYESLNKAHFDIPFPRTIVEQVQAHA